MKGDLEKRVRALLQDKNALRNVIGRREHTIRQLQNRLTESIEICEMQQEYIERLEAQLLARPERAGEGREE